MNLPVAGAERRTEGRKRRNELQAVCRVEVGDGRTKVFTILIRGAESLELLGNIRD